MENKLESSYSEKEIRDKFEKLLKKNGYSQTALEQDEYGYINWDIELTWNSYRSGYLEGKQAGMSEVADDSVSKTDAEKREGSSPSTSTRR